MKLSKATHLLLFVLVVIIWSSCSSGKSAYEHGNYYDAVITSVNRLRRNTDNKKSSETLRSAYPMAVRYYEDKANAAIASNVEFKWKEVVQHYTTLQSMYDEIQRSPGALRVVPNPSNYQAKLSEARQKAAEESYNAGIMALGAGDRSNAKKAYYLFIDANNFTPGYKDVVQKIEDARWAATVKVAVDPIPVVAKNYALDAHYFDSKLNEYLKSIKTNEFIKFYKAADVAAQKITPDHIVQLSFEEFSIGQVYVNEKESQVEHDSVLVAYLYTDTKGTFQQTQTEAPKIVPAVTVGTTAGGTGNTTTKTAETTSKTGSDANSNTTTNTNTQTSNPQTTTNTNTNTVNTTSTNTTSTNNNTNNSNTTISNNSTNNTNTTTQTTTPANNTNTSSTQSSTTNTQTSDKNNQNTESKPEKKDDDAGDSKEAQVIICHQPPGNQSERKTLTIGLSALKAHMSHGDVVGDCKTENKSKGKDGSGGMASLTIENSVPIMIASASNDRLWYLFAEENAIVDTTKVYGKVKATVHHFKKTIASRGVLNFRIIDAKTKAVISEQRMPSESVWISEWLTYNGDSRALSSDQTKLATQKELPPPTNQDLFAEFTKPLFDQITTKITEFYKSY